MRVFSCSVSNGGFWFRIFGVGLSFVHASYPALFSERYGYRKSIKLFGYRASFLGMKI